MASMNDLLTVSLVLILLFGAVSLYIYTRIQQCEQKLNLVESILLDIKMSAELREYPDVPLKSESYSQVSQPSQSLPSPLAAPFEEEETTGLDSSDLSEPEALPEATTINVAPEPVAKPSVSVNYESMTLAELKSLAKQRGITGSSSMKRSQILEALHTSDNKVSSPADGGILSALAEASSSLTDGDMAVLA
jgi:hypothetical protein